MPGDVVPFPNDPAVQRFLDDHADTPLWRYLDPLKLLSLLHTEALYFCRADLVGDPFEGAIPEQDHQLWYDSLRHAFRSVLPDLSQDQVEETIANFRRTRTWVYLNCWHINDHESAAMWSLYSAAGVAVRSTIGRLSRALTPPDGTTVQLGPVQYVDYSSHRLPHNHPLLPFFHKRRSFEHESEFRALVFEHLGPPGATTPGPPGKLIPVDLATLIETIHVAPNRGSWEREAIEAGLRRFGLEMPVVKSRLDDSPLY